MSHGWSSASLVEMRRRLSVTRARPRKSRASADTVFQAGAEKLKAHFNTFISVSASELPRNGDWPHNLRGDEHTCRDVKTRGRRKVWFTAKWKQQVCCISDEKGIFGCGAFLGGL